MEKTKRLTIGVLTGYHVYEGSRPAAFAVPVIRGMQAAARDKDINLIAACGIAGVSDVNVHRPAWPEAGPEMDFVPVGPWNTDGLIFLGPLRTPDRIQFARSLQQKGFPVLIMGGDAGSPAVVVDNEGGIRQAIEHLAGHGHRSIAFIAGDRMDSGDSAVRLETYRQGVRECGLNDDPRLVEYGDHWDVGGYEAMQRVLQSGVALTAVMCSNDISAIGAMRALREAGRNIPEDAAVAGFDDILEGQAEVPPLTSVHYPLFETGYRALLLLHKRIEQGPGSLPDLTRVGTWLAPRQSCGCLPEMIANSVFGGDPNPPSTDPFSQEFRKSLSHSMLDALLTENTQYHSGDFLPFCESLSNGFLDSLKENSIVPFQDALTDVLQHVEMDTYDNAHVWQSAVSVLRRAAYAAENGSGNAAPARHAEDMLHQARTMVSESVERRYTRLQVRRAGLDERMGMLTARLISSSDREQIYATLREDLPRVGVRTCHIAFFEPRGGDPVAGSVLKSLEKGAAEVRFETRRFPPAGIFPEGRPFNLALLPLTYQEERMGYVAFDGGNLDPLATLVRQLASSIKNAQLHEKVLDLSLTDGLTGVHNRRYFEIMLQKETERSRRYRRDLAVIMIDIDRFKLYNDAFGHPAGDDALREIAGCIVRGARRGLDVVTRYGGEEFAVILPETDVEGARKVAENVRRKVEGNADLLQPTTVSLGIASLSGDKLRPQELVDEADRALYRAKEQGRNRTVVYAEWMTKAAHAKNPPKTDAAGANKPSGKPAASKPRKRRKKTPRDNA